MTVLGLGAAPANRPADRHSELADFFAAVECAVARATASAGAVTRDYRIAGQRVRLRFAGQGLVAAIAPALAHLAQAGTAAEPDLTVALWDSAGTGIAMPHPLWSASAYTARGDILGFDDPRYRVTFDVYSGVLTMVDMARGRAVCWVEDARRAPTDMQAKPLLHAFQWWLASRNCQPLHAGLVGVPAGAALLAGQSGAGKSTTVLACLAAGLLYLSDDFCMVELGDSPQAHSLYSSGRLHPGDLETLPFLKPWVSNPDRLDSEKALFFLHEGFAAHLRATLPLRVVLLPRVCDQPDTTWEPAPPAAAREALTAGTLPLLPSAGAPAALYSIHRLVARLPCCYLNLGSDRQQIPNAIRAILNGTFVS